MANPPDSIVDVARRAIQHVEETERAFYVHGDGSPEWLKALTALEEHANPTNHEMMARWIVRNAPVVEAANKSLREAARRAEQEGHQPEHRPTHFAPTGSQEEKG